MKRAGSACGSCARAVEGDAHASIRPPAAGGACSCWAPHTTSTPSTAFCRPRIHTPRRWVRARGHLRAAQPAPHTSLAMPCHSIPCVCAPPHPPAGSASIDREVYQQLRGTGKFQEMQLDADEAEHSLELHLPYLVHCMRGHPFTLVPIVVGAISNEAGACWGAGAARRAWQGDACAARVCLPACLLACTAPGHTSPHLPACPPHVAPQSHVRPQRLPTAGCWPPIWTTPQTSSSSLPTSATGAAASGTPATTPRRCGRRAGVGLAAEWG